MQVHLVVHVISGECQIQRDVCASVGAADLSVQCAGLEFTVGWDSSDVSRNVIAKWMNESIDEPTGWVEFVQFTERKTPNGQGVARTI